MEINKVKKCGPHPCFAFVPARCQLVLFEDCAEDGQEAGQSGEIQRSDQGQE